MRYYYLGILAMAICSYIPRFIPLTFYRKKIQSNYIKKVLYFLPFASLGALTFPGVFKATPSLIESIVGLIVAAFLAYKGKGLVFVAISSIIACLIVGVII